MSLQSEGEKGSASDRRETDFHPGPRGFLLASYRLGEDGGFQARESNSPDLTIKASAGFNYLNKFRLTERATTKSWHYKLTDCTVKRLSDSVSASRLVGGNWFLVFQLAASAQRIHRPGERLLERLGDCAQVVVYTSREGPCYPMSPTTETWGTLVRGRFGIPRPGPPAGRSGSIGEGNLSEMRVLRPIGVWRKARV